MKKIILFCFILHLLSFNIYANYYYTIEKPDDFQNKFLNFGKNKCEFFQEDDIPTIFIPGILASWYSEEGFENSKVKRWIPDPITHSYDTLFYTFKDNGYELKDVFYKDEYNIYIEGNPKKSLYLFGYDWKKDNKITSTILNDLISKIRENYIAFNGCDIGKVNIIAHSMGGLIARGMLEDMCVSDVELEEYKNIKQSNGKIKNFSNNQCKDQTKINKLITISTPHRGSPQSFPIWEKGDLYSIESFSKSATLLNQLGFFSTNNLLESAILFDPIKQTTSNDFYLSLHGYNKKIPNGIITIGQLLPDIKNNNIFNNNLKYLQKNQTEILNKNYPINGFLEDLNKNKNIDKMWDRIDNKYYSYYSLITGNYNKNNILGYELLDTNYDVTNLVNGEDIYNNYSKQIGKNYYLIGSNLRNQSGLGGDGTVPSYNLLLSANDLLDSKQVKNEKFESIELKCYGNYIPKDINNIKNDFDYYSSIYKNIGTNSIYEACSHSNTPISLSYKIYSNISGKGLNLIDNINKDTYERKQLLQNIGYTNYFINKFYAGGNLYKKVGIDNNRRLNDIFENNYVKLLSKDDIKNDSEKNPIKVSLSFDGILSNISSVFTRYDILSPINLLIEDEYGRKIGIDPDTGFIINEIPGSWTSGNTDGSNETEFFLIPKTGTGNTIHKIKTYGTGKGEYNIVKREFDINNSQNINKDKLIISGIAMKNFGEDYIIKINDSKDSFENLSNQIPTTIDINKKNIITSENKYNILYTIRGKNNNIEKIKYNLIYNDKIILKKIENIEGIINLDFDNKGKYILALELIDSNGDILDNNESKKLINIYNFTNDREKLDIINKLEQIIKKLDTKYSKKQKNIILNLLKNKKEYIFSKIKDDNKKLIISYIIDELIEYLNEKLSKIS